LYKKQLVIVLLSGLMLVASAFPLYKLYKQDSGLSRLQAVGSSAVISNYFKNFSPSYLFISGDTNPRSQVPNQSQLCLIDALFLVLGIIYSQIKESKIIFSFSFIVVSSILQHYKRNPHALFILMFNGVDY
jgi:hypothetical protein